MVQTVPTRRSTWAPLLLLLLLVACGGGNGGNGGGGGGGGGGTPNPPPAPPPPPPPGVPQVKGGEPLYWDQGATSLGEAKDYRYTLYVNALPQPLPGHACAATNATGVFTCNAGLPANLPAGLVTLAVSAVRDASGTTYESQRSAPLQVFVLTGAAAARATQTSAVLRMPGTDPAPEEDATPVVDLAALPDGRLLSVDARGRVGLVDGGHIVGTMLDASMGGAQVVSLAAGADFPQSRAVFAVEAADDRGAEIWDLTRYREVEGTLGERAVIVPGITARVGLAARLRVGPDGLLYLVAFDAPSSAGGAQTVSIFRLEADGAVPSGQPALLLRSGVAKGLALDWHPASGEPWLAPADVAAAAFVGGPAPGTRLAAMVVALTDGSLERRVVSAGDFDRVVRRGPVRVGPSVDATAVARAADGTIRAALSAAGKAPAIRPLDPK